MVEAFSAIKVAVVSLSSPTVRLLFDGQRTWDSDAQRLYGNAVVINAAGKIGGLRIVASNIAYEPTCGEARQVILLVNSCGYLCRPCQAANDPLWIDEDDLAWDLIFLFNRPADDAGGRCFALALHRRLHREIPFEVSGARRFFLGYLVRRNSYPILHSTSEHVESLALKPFG